MEPFRKSFSSQRLQRQLNESLRRENASLADQQAALASANEALGQTTDNLLRANRELDEFAHAASHDLKSPLRAIDNLSMFVIEDLGDAIPAPVQDHLTEMRRRVQRMERMLSGLLSYSRVQRETLNREEFTVREALDESVAFLNIPSGFSVELPEAGFTIRSPRPPLEQVIRNLVENAIKHHDRDHGVVTIDATQREGWVDFVITDDGPGIPESSQEKVFQMFHKLQRPHASDSNGMGLALVKRIIEHQGGKIGIRSEGERGTTFHFTWPIDADAVSSPASAASSAPTPGLCSV